MGKIKVTECGGIKGLKVVEPTVFGDARGYFMETYNYNDFKEAGIDVEFVQDNQSSSHKGVLRGLHFQINYPQDKLVRVVNGEVFDVAVDLREGSETYGYGKLDFSKYMEQFISDRFVDFEIKVDKADGLKIPVSAVTDKNFYLIPLEYMTQGGDSSEDGFYKEVYTENGTSIVFVPTTVYYSDEEFYYVDMGEENGFKAGDYVVRPESSDRYQIGRTASLKGVYNINKGYTIFKQIDILDSNSEYYTVRKNMKYGLSVYDHIVLDASMVEEGQLLYQ